MALRISKTLISQNLLKCSLADRVISSRLLATKIPEELIPKNKLEEYITAHKIKQTGSIYDKKPFKLFLEKDKIYHWCSCGKSKSQPLCDKTHAFVPLKIKMRPVRFAVDESKEYWLCNCKQTKHRPFCDGTHECEEVQSALKFPKFS